MANVLVTDGDERAALAIVRSLGRAGHIVHVASDTGRSIAGASRHAATEATTPSPLGNSDAYFGALAALAASRHADVVIPVGEAALRGTLPRRNELPYIPFPDVEVFESVCDKGHVLDVARGLGIPDATFAVARSSEQLSAQLRELPKDAFPVVLKPTRSVVRSSSGATKTSVFYVRNRAEIDAAAGLADPDAFPVLLQRKVEGRGTGVFLLLWKGEVLALFAHRRLREKPPSGGVSVLSESITPSPELVTHSTRLLRALQWEGVAMVEYKEDRVSGGPVLMEINGRFWGSLQLAIDSGVDFPALLVGAATGEPIVPATSYVTGVRTRWVLGDLDHLIARLTRSREALGLPSSAPGRASASFDFLRDFLPPVRSEVSRRGDRAPARREAVRWLQTVLRADRG